MGHVENLRPLEAVPRADDGEGVSLDKGKRKAFIEFVQKNGRSLSIPYHFIDDVEADFPHYRKLVIVFVKRDLVTVTLEAGEGGTLRALHKRIKAQMIGQVIERDGLREKGAGGTMDANGDEFAVAAMRIDVKKG
ncbi:hypothetical protein TA3x_000426 [Tundrisphaera sp. TA3]|uniref:hypothetical protein n=1 Tax=Tundrisphaera sp. TA3 TaxID=3435775 RepID=UPI003EC0C683